MCTSLMSEANRIQVENMPKPNGLGQRIPEKHMMTLQEINEARDIGGSMEARDRDRKAKKN